MTNAERIIDSITRWLLDGPLGDKQRGEDYRNLISCGFRPALIGGADIGKIRTSCAICVRAILDDARVLPARTPGRIGWPMWGGWLSELHPNHPSWVRYTLIATPRPGAVFYVEKRATNNNHVGFFVEDLGSGLWKTAEGGGGDGTRFAYGLRTLGKTFDRFGRDLIGWFDPDRIDFERKPTDPEMPAVRDDDT